MYLISAKSYRLLLDFILLERLAKFLDVHSLEGIQNEGTLRKLQQSPIDEFGVKHINIMFNRQANICFCFLEAPNREAVERHHERYSIKCNWITEVQILD
jgi:hypothetical protein